MRIFLPITVETFDRVFDELFDQMLITRWRHAERGRESPLATVLDRGDCYEVQIFTGDVPPEKIDVEASEHRLTVRMPSLEGDGLEQSFNFNEPIDMDAVTSRWFQRRLVTVLHKLKRKRRINVASD